MYKHTKSGWKLTKENVDNLLPDLKDTLGSVPPDTPVVLFCLDNSCFMGLDEDGSMNPISKCVEGESMPSAPAGPRIQSIPVSIYMPKLPCIS